MKNFIVTMLADNLTTNEYTCATRNFYCVSFEEAKGLMLNYFQNKYPQYNSIRACFGYEIYANEHGVIFRK